MKSTSDRDYFRVAFAAGERVTILCAIPDGAYDADLYLLDSSGSTLARSVNDGAGTDESLTFTRTATGSSTYYLELDAYQGSGSSPYTCTLTKGRVAAHAGPAAFLRSGTLARATEGCP
ncbi:PPC domain-containing protein [Streptomyces lavendulae]|uniref:PPC domain-containing protein n=1 Tax=Streptomyces lavendulae TaxID=1914 RepID=UPI003408E25B